MLLLSPEVLRNWGRWREEERVAKFAWDPIIPLARSKSWDPFILCVRFLSLEFILSFAPKRVNLIYLPWQINHNSVDHKWVCHVFLYGLRLHDDNLQSELYEMTIVFLWFKERISISNNQKLSGAYHFSKKSNINSIKTTEYFNLN